MKEKGKKAKKHWMWGCVYLRRKLNSLTFPTAPFPLTLPLPVVHQSCLNTLITKSCFLHSGWTLSTRPPAKAVSQLRCVKQTVSRFIWANRASHSCRACWSAYSPTCLYIITAVCSSQSAPYNVTAFIVGFLAALLFTRCLELQSVPVFTCQSRLRRRSECWDFAAGLFTLTICCCTTRHPLSSSHGKHTHSQRHMRI